MVKQLCYQIIGGAFVSAIALFFHILSQMGAPGAFPTVPGCSTPKMEQNKYSVTANLF